MVSTSKSSAAKRPPTKPSNPYANYSTAESLGYKDPDAERHAAEVQIKRMHGIAGDWHIVTPTAPQPIASDISQVHTNDVTISSTGEAEGAGMKRGADIHPEEDVRSFKLRKKTINTGLGEIYDPGAIPIKLKKREELEDVLTPHTALSSSIVADPEPQQGTLPKWNKIQLVGQPKDGSSTNDITIKNEGGTSSSKWAEPKWSEPLPENTPSDRASIFDSGKSEGDAPPLVAGKKTDVKVEENEIKSEDILGTPDESLSATGMFKRRRAPVNVGRRREI